MTELDHLLKEIRACRLCEAHLPLPPNPVLRASASARLLVIGQAPGTLVNASGIPWNDATGMRLRGWLGIDRVHFYDEAKIANVPIGFCYPGHGSLGDLPPRPECAQTWHSRLISMLPEVRLTLAIGHHAQVFLLGDARKKSLTDTVQAWKEYGPRIFPLPHPSPRTVAWLKHNPWFETETLPALRDQVAAALAD
jgi:uracil-DNA glycosylase